ncbi:MAG TPA: FliA/WhiG family RNA polymerase sigma factor [Terriglobales bacterium]|nr:FliA/WhiG family RNA polymerase sigma factor [Terriglobales bacterium]
MTRTTTQEYTAWRDEEERERILLEQMPQVHYIARRIHERLPRHVAVEDLVHAGVLGLIDALNKFDQSKHVQFSSYAKFRIRGAILDSLREIDWSPRELRRKARQVQDVHNQLCIQLGRSPNELEMAEALGLDLRDFQALLAELDGLEIGSLHVYSPKDGRDEDLCEFLPSAPEETPFFQCLRSEMKKLLAESIAELPDKERQVLALYYFEELTMKEVGELLGIGESRVSQIHSIAVIRLRGRLQQLLESRPQKAAAVGAM